MSKPTSPISDIRARIQRIQNEALMLRSFMIQHKDELQLKIPHIFEQTAGILSHAEALDPADHPDNHDRTVACVCPGRLCTACDHDLELNADFQCVRCGSHA